MAIVKVDKNKCKGCGLCLGVCPQNNLEPANKENAKGFIYVKVKAPSKCTGCGLCYLICPDTAIEIYEEEKK